jgi:hypothetical protein
LLLVGVDDSDARRCRELLDDVAASEFDTARASNLAEAMAYLESNVTD